MADLSIHPAQTGDYSKITSFLNFQNHVHRHLDWRSPMDWLGQQPFLLAEEKGNIRAVLACPPDPPQIAWVRIFASSNLIVPRKAWNILINNTVQILGQQDHCRLVSLALQDWFETLLVSSGFTTSQSIIVLEWDGRLPAPAPLPDSISIRKMNAADLAEVKNVDKMAFDPLWHNSLDSLTLAFKQSTVSTVAVDENVIVGYQISTSIPFNGHLARLAVSPAFQEKKIGYNLVYHLLVQFKKLGIMRVTVNTQSNNSSSIALYEKMGFRKTGETFPVYEYPLR